MSWNPLGPFLSSSMFKALGLGDVEVRHRKGGLGVFEAFLYALSRWTIGAVSTSLTCRTGDIVTRP